MLTKSNTSQVAVLNAIAVAQEHVQGVSLDDLRAYAKRQGERKPLTGEALPRRAQSNTVATPASSPDST